MQEKSTPYYVKIFRWLPILFDVAIIVWAYYAYAIYMCFYAVTNLTERIIYLVFFNLLVILLCISLFRAIFTPVARVPKDFFLTDEELIITGKNKDALIEIIDRKASKLQVQARNFKGKFRFCELCNCVKPDRSHHCSSCRHCVLKMDHHCPWINNCVNFNNYKYFFLFLLYTLLCSLFVMGTSLQYFIQFWNDFNNKQLMVNFMRLSYVVLCLFTFVLALGIGFFWVTHCVFIKKNVTTLESMRTPIFRSGPDKNAYNRGCKSNFEEVFGKIKWRWFLPVHSQLGDGVTFPARITATPYTYESINSVAPSKIDITPIMIQPTADLNNHNSYLKTSKNEGALYSSIPMNDVMPEKRGKFM